MTQHELRGGITSEMDEYIQKQVDLGFYDSRAEYIRSLVREDMRVYGDVQ